MIWPAGTPNAITLPPIPDPEPRDSTILSLEISKPGYLLTFLTHRGLYLYRPKPLCPVLVYVRSKSSLEKYGENAQVLIRPDCGIVVVTTSKDCVLTFALLGGSTKELGVFTYADNSPLFVYEGQTIATAFPGPGEAIGIRELGVQFKMVIRLDSGIGSAMALDNELLVLTKNPPAVQLVKWSTHSASVILLSNMAWLDDHSGVIHMRWSKAMGLFSWTTTGGKVWAVTMDSTGNFQGHCIHKESGVVSGINARFSIIAVGTSSGHIYLYNVKDYSGNVPLVKVLDPPTTSAGKVVTVSASSDGYGWFVGYENEWATFSVFGMLTSSSYLSSAEKEPWLGGVQSALWSFSSDTIYMIPKVNDTVWMIDILKWNSAGNFNVDNMTRPVLYKDAKIMLYRGQEQSDLTTIDKDALLWLSVPIPASYIAENWPIKYVSTSRDGMYVAVAGLRGLTHYSLYSGHWKQFVEEDIELEFSVRGGILWYGNIIIIAVDTESSHEIQLYNRETELDSQTLLHSEEIDATVINIFIVNDSLMVYTNANQLLQFRIHISDNQDVSLELVTDISFIGVIHSPARVRSINCLPKQDIRRTPFLIDECDILLLIDGMLILLTPRNSTTQMNYKYKLLHSHIEFFSLTPGKGALKNLLWAFDGRTVIVWPSGLAYPSVSVPIELYPLTMMPEKGILMGIDCDAVLSRNGGFTYFKMWTGAQLFAPYILEEYIAENDNRLALTVASGFRHLNYFGHILELLLYRVLDSVATGDRKISNDNSNSGSKDILTEVMSLVANFPQYLEVVLGCVRKTELKYWPLLFDRIGSPQLLFDQCIEKNKLSTASGYLLVLHSMDILSGESTKLLLKLGYERGMWELCREVCRFICLDDPTGETLRKTLDDIGIQLNPASITDREG